MVKCKRLVQFAEKSIRRLITKKSIAVTVAPNKRIRKNKGISSTVCVIPTIPLYPLLGLTSDRTLWFCLPPIGFCIESLLGPKYDGLPVALGTFSEDFMQFALVDFYDKCLSECEAPFLCGH